MSHPDEQHDELLIGLRVVSGEPKVGAGSTVIKTHPGTLTGVGRKRGTDHRVLVTAAHETALAL